VIGRILVSCTGGSQNRTIAQNQLPNVSPSATFSGTQSNYTVFANGGSTSLVASNHVNSGFPSVSGGFEADTGGFAQGTPVSASKPPLTLGNPELTWFEATRDVLPPFAKTV